MRKDSEVFLRKLLEYKNEVQKENFSINCRYFKEIPSIESAIYDILKDLINNNCLTSNSQVTDLEGNININLTLDGITYFDDFENKDRGKSIFLNVSGGQVNIANDNGKIQAFVSENANDSSAVIKNECKVCKETGLSLKGNKELLNSMKEVNEQERVVNENNNPEYNFVISDIYDEIRKVLQGLEPNSKNSRYYFDYEILEEKGVMKIITDDLANVDYNMKKNICQYLWKKTFIDAQKDIDFCYIYLLIDLFNNQKVRIKLSKEMQRLETYDINGFYPDKIRYWHTSVEAMFYLLERCPQVYYEMLDDPLKAKLRIAAENNLKYIVREFYLWDSTKKHIEHIKEKIEDKIEQEEPYVKSLKTNSPKCAIWYSEDLLFLYNSKKTESEKNEVVDFIITLFRNCHYYDRASGLFDAVFYLLNESVIKEGEIIDIVNKNSQIYGTKEYADYLEIIMNCVSARLNLEEYPNINKIFQDNYNDRNL